MKPLTSSLYCLALASSPILASPESVAPQYPPHVIADSQLRILPRTEQGREYQLHVALPASYAKEPAKRYPVLYVTDGYWDFPTIKTSYDNLVYDRVVPEFIIVGLGYAGENLDYGVLRRWELSPVPVGEPGEASGHAADFLQTLEQTFIPFIDREYRTDTAYRVLAGSSLGGMFTLYTMYTKPELFQGYIAASPAVLLQNDWLFRYEEAFAKTGKPIEARLYLAGAENEWPSFLAGIKRFHQQISSRKYKGFAYDYRLIDGERHAGTKAESYVRGMRFVFEPLAPETGPMKDRTF
jgi:predicted alpha/beta superfamily hydrolase